MPSSANQTTDGGGHHPRKHVVIVGGGFAGLAAARELGGRDVDVTVLDRTNHHLFQPLLYQVATALLNPADIAVPLRHALRARNVEVLLTTVHSIDLPRKVLSCSHGDVGFDALILAAGATHSYFGHPEWEANAPGLKTVEDALEIRRRILLAYEMAEREPDPERRRAWMTFVVVGGGPTGVELAGALSEIAHLTLRREYRHIDPSSARVLLVEGLPRLLTAWPERLGERARRDLEGRGVEVRTGAFVTAVDADAISIGDERIATRTVLWGAGVRTSGLTASLGAPLDRAGRVRVEATLALPGHDDVYVVGDAAAAESDGRPVPGLAAAAIQGGRHAARNILRSLAGRPITAFHYRDRGSFAVIGRGAAVGVAFRRFPMNGVIAWLAWLGIHIAFLVGFRNRVAVLLGWAYTFFTRRRPMRLITSVRGLDTGEAVDAAQPPRDRSARPAGAPPA